MSFRRQVNDNDKSPAASMDGVEVLGRRFMPVTVALTYSGIGRTALYRAIAQGKVLARKAGRATLIERESLDRHLDDLPAAKIGKQQSV